MHNNKFPHHARFLSWGLMNHHSVPSLKEYEQCVAMWVADNVDTKDRVWESGTGQTHEIYNEKRIIAIRFRNEDDLTAFKLRFR